MYFSQQGSQISHYFFISKVKISLQMDKFPGNDLAKMPIFSHYAYSKHAPGAVCISNMVLEHVWLGKFF